jgi:hypothetical protein
MEKHCSPVKESFMLEARGPISLFSSELSLMFKGILHTSQCCHMRGTSICTKPPLSMKGTSTDCISCKTNMDVRSRRSSTCFRKGIELLMQGNTSYHSVFSWMMNITFVQTHPVRVNGRCSVASVRESLMFEAKGSSTLFSIVN